MALDTAASKTATNTNGDGASAEDENKKKTGAGTDKSQETAEADEQPSLGATAIADKGAIVAVKTMDQLNAAGAQGAVVDLTLTDKQKEEKQDNSWGNMFSSIGTFFGFGKKSEKTEQVEKETPKPPTDKDNEEAEDTGFFDWLGLGDKFGSFFGTDKTSDEGGEKKTFQSKNDITGDSSTTEIADASVRNRTVDKNGKVINDTRVDGTGAVDTNDKGDVAVWNRETGEHRSRFHDGSEAGYNPQTGEHDYKDKQGRRGQVGPDGKWVYTPREGEAIRRDGPNLQVDPRNGNDLTIEVTPSGNPATLNQQDGSCDDDKPDDDTPGGNGNRARHRTFRDKETGEIFQRTRVQDGVVIAAGDQGSLMMWSRDKDGNRVHIKAHKDNPSEMEVTTEDRQVTLRRNEENDNWDVVGQDGKVIGTGENGEIKLFDGTVLARIQLDRDGIGAQGARVTTNGEVAVNTAGGSRVTSDGTTTQIQNPAGTTTDIVKTGPDGATTVENLGPDGKGPAPGVVSEVITVGPDGQGTITERKENGSEDPIVNFDTTPAPGGKIFEMIGGPNGTGVVYTDDPSGKGIMAEYGNGDKAFADGTLQRSNGVTYHSNGDVTFPDGTRVDPFGHVTDRDGNSMGTAGGDWEGSAADGGTQARINAAISVAKDLASKPNPSPGDIAYLLSLLGSLGSAKADAIKSGDAGTFFAADLAQATVSANISDLQSKIGQQSMMQMMASIPPSLAAQLSNESGTHDAHAIRQMLENHGVHTNGGR